MLFLFEGCDTYRAGGEIDEADSADNAGLWVIWEEDGD